LEEITLSGNSYGREACDTLAQIFSAEKTPLLRQVNFNDMFVSRKLLELPGSLEVLVRSILESQGGLLRDVNLSDNAFGPAGIKSFDFLLRELKSLKTLKVTNCGLGPEGGEMIANALAENKDLKLV
jgi:Ran GTPase-activating protein 1